MTLSRSVDLPDPETPLRQTKRRSGRAKERLARLCLVALAKVSHRFAGCFNGAAAPSPRWERGEGAASPFPSNTTARRVPGTGIDSRPEKYAPVMLRGEASICGTVP